MIDHIKSLILAALILVPPVGESAAQSVNVFRLGPSDEIEVSVWEEPNLSATVIVRPDGKVSLPLIGSVDVAGKTPEDVETELRQRYLTFLGDPIVVVIVRGFNSAQVSLLGEVRSPGRYPLQQAYSVLDAIAAAGGFTDFANIGDVIVLRLSESEVQRLRVNVKEFLDKDGGSLLMLLPGDVVYVK